MYVEIFLIQSYSIQNEETKEYYKDAFFQFPLFGYLCFTLWANRNITPIQTNQAKQQQIELELCKYPLDKNLLAM